jgi:hypothetical protein
MQPFCSVWEGMSGLRRASRTGCRGGARLRRALHRSATALHRCARPKKFAGGSCTVVERRCAVMQPSCTARESTSGLRRASRTTARRGARFREGYAPSQNSRARRATALHRRASPKKSSGGSCTGVRGWCAMVQAPCSAREGTSGFAASVAHGMQRRRRIAESSAPPCNGVASSRNAEEICGRLVHGGGRVCAVMQPSCSAWESTSGCWSASRTAVRRRHTIARGLCTVAQRPCTPCNGVAAPREAEEICGRPVHRGGSVCAVMHAPCTAWESASGF